MSEDHLKLTRRLFLQHSATVGAATAWYSIAMKTDAIARADEKSVAAFRHDGILPYSYMEGPR